MASLWFDGASSGNGTGPAGYGFVLVDSSGNELVRISMFLGYRYTNNQAEYEALIAGLRKARDLNIDHIHIYGDSQLVVNQVNGDWQVLNATLSNYRRQARELLDTWFRSWAIIHVGRENNQLADSLAKQGARQGA